MRAAIFLVAVVGSPMTFAQIPVPPPPPAPTSGTIQCELKDERGGSTHLKGELTQTDLIEGKQYPRVNFKSDKNDTFSGMFSATWTSGSGEFIDVSGDGKIITSMTLVTPTYKSGPGAMAAEVTDHGHWRNIPKYYAGFCQFTNSNAVGN